MKKIDELSNEELLIMQEENYTNWRKKTIKRTIFFAVQIASLFLSLPSIINVIIAIAAMINMASCVILGVKSLIKDLDIYEELKNRGYDEEKINKETKSLIEKGVTLENVSMLGKSPAFETVFPEFSIKELNHNKENIFKR